MCLLLAAITIVPGSLMAGGELVPDFQSPPPPFPPDPSDRQFSVEVASLGAGLALPPMGEFRMLRFTFIWDSWRAGLDGPTLSAFLLYDIGGSIVTARFGRTLYRRPRRTAFFYGMVPDVYAEASLGWGVSLTARACIAAEFDFWGLGAGVELGVLTTEAETIPFDQNRRYWTPYLELRLRGLCFTFDAGRRR